MASDAGSRGKVSAPGQISRRGCLFLLLTLVIAAVVLACAALFVLHRLFPAPPVVWSANGEQFAQLRSLQGTWHLTWLTFAGSRETCRADLQVPGFP
jgi:hypothetical protein